MEEKWKRNERKGRNVCVAKACEGTRGSSTAILNLEQSQEPINGISPLHSLSPACSLSPLRTYTQRQTSQLRELMANKCAQRRGCVGRGASVRS